MLIVRMSYIDGLVVGGNIPDTKYGLRVTNDMVKDMEEIVV